MRGASLANPWVRPMVLRRIVEPMPLATVALLQVPPSLLQLPYVLAVVAQRSRRRGERQTLPLRVRER